MKEEYILPGSILVAAVLIAGAVIYTAGMPGAIDNNLGGENQPVIGNAEALKLTSSDVVLGDPDAPVTVVEYSDYQCPFCGRFFAQTEPQIRANYIQSGKVKLVYRHLVVISQESADAANATECAKDQGKFWDFHDAMFAAEMKDGEERNGNLNRSLFMSVAGQLQMNTAEFGSCLDSGKYASKVNTDSATAKVLGVNATPTFFVNGLMIQGAVPFSDFKSAIDSALAK